MIAVSRLQETVQSAARHVTPVAGKAPVQSLPTASRAPVWHLSRA